MNVDIRDARFYVVDEGIAAIGHDAEPLEFDEAIERALSLKEAGAQIHVLYTQEATQIEITRFVSQGIPASLVSGG